MSGGEEKKPSARGKKKLRDALDNAVPVEPTDDGGGGETGGVAPPDDGWPLAAAGGDDAAARPDDWKPWHPYLGPDSPVIPLGQSADYLYILDERRFLQEISTRTVKDLDLVKWFGGKSYLVARWRKHVRGKADPTWDHSEAKQDLVEGCTKAGTFNPGKKVRGRGCWLGDAGELIVHTGRNVLISGRQEPASCGVVQDYIYPLVEPFLRVPTPMLAKGEVLDCAGEEILETLKTWNFARGDLDAQLMAGWIVTAILGGALSWRAIIWLTGEKGTGKSTLHEFVVDLLSPGIVATANTTAAGIYQHVGLDSLPVAVDELEPSANPARVQAIIELARQAASGNLMLRGGATHQGVHFEARSAFLFSAIVMPPMDAQDLSRTAILELNDLPKVKRRPLPTAKQASAWGSALLWRLIRQWHRWPATLAAYKAALAQVGHDDRGQAQFGGLLAGAHMALWDGVPTAQQIAEDGFVARLDATRLAETKFNARDYERCCEWLGSRSFEIFRGGTPSTINDLLREAHDNKNADLHVSRKNLEKMGLKYLMNPRPNEKEKTVWLRGPHVAVSTSHAGTSRLFQDSKWQSPPGLTGGWVGSLKRVPGAALSGKRIDGASRNCVLVPLTAFLDMREDHDVRQAEEVSELEAAAG